MKYNLTPKEILNRIEQIRKIDNLQKDENVKPLTEYEKESLPTIPKGWEWTIINDISEFITNGVHTPTSPIDENGYGLHCLRITDIQNNNIDYKKLPYALRIVETDYGKKLKKGDIYFSFTGNNLGKRFIVHENRNDTVFAHYFVRWHPILVNPYFVYYVTFSNIYDWFINVNKHGSTQPNLKVKDLKRFPIPLCDLITQEKIAKILKSLDDKIALNILINDNLLKIIKKYYNEKFYNKNGRMTILSSLIKQTIGGDWGKENQEGNYNKKVYCIRGADIPQMVYGNKGKSPIRYILEKNYNKKKLSSNEIIIEISGGSPSQSTGRVAFISEKILKLYENSLICTNFCRAIELNDEKYAPLLYVYLLSLYDDKIFFNYENGTTGIKNLSLTDLINKEHIFIPNDDELLIFNKLFYSLFNKIIENSNENQNLEQFRDTLLPKLMNGEIDLENIEI